MFYSTHLATSKSLEQPVCRCGDFLLVWHVRANSELTMYQVSLWALYSSHEKWNINIKFIDFLIQVNTNYHA